jgi:ABC-type bacteriocin/lantibiotic exporter with double-glycine peptidase domain
MALLKKQLKKPAEESAENLSILEECINGNKTLAATGQDNSSIKYLPKYLRTLYARLSKNITWRNQIEYKV